MDFDLSEEMLAVRETARAFAEKEIAPTAGEDDREHRFRSDLVAKMGHLGFFGCVTPEKYGGTDLGFIALAIISEEIARAHSAMRVFINMQVGPARTVERFGTEEQKSKNIPDLVSGKTLSCFAITEPDAASDVSAISTTAVREGSSYILNGAKTWISNAPIAHTALVYASTNRSEKHRGLSAFYFDLDRPGISRRTLDKLGTHSSPTGQLFFEDCRIPVGSRVGGEGEGFKICLEMLSDTRLNCAAGALGVARAARESAVRYANERKQFGRKIGEFQMIQDVIAEMIVREEAARLLVHRAAFLKDRGRASNLETSVAKYSAAEAAAFAADGAFKILGAYGYSTEYPVERYLRDAKSYQIVEGSSNIQKIIIAEDALGYRKANRGST